MTYNVFSGTLNPTQSINHLYVHCQFCVSTVSIMYTVHFHSHACSQCLLLDHLVCSLSVLSVHCQYKSTVHFQIFTALCAVNVFTLLLNSCGTSKVRKSHFSGG